MTVQTADQAGDQADKRQPPAVVQQRRPECFAEGQLDIFPTIVKLAKHRSEALTIYLSARPMAQTDAQADDQTGQTGPVKREKRVIGTRKCHLCAKEGKEVIFQNIADLQKHRAEVHPEEVQKGVNLMHAALQVKKEKDKVARQQAEQDKIAQEDPIKLIALLGREGLNKLKRIRLVDLLTDTYAQIIKEWHRKSAIGKWDRNPTIRDNPQAFLWTLVNEARIAQDITIIRSRVCRRLAEERVNTPHIWSAGTSRNKPSHTARIFSNATISI